MKLALLVIVVALVVLGCGTALVLLVHPNTGSIIECREDLFDGIPDTLGQCVRAYEALGYRVRSPR